jgi:hypothetical protein
LFPTKPEGFQIRVLPEETKAWSTAGEPIALMDVCFWILVSAKKTLRCHCFADLNVPTLGQSACGGCGEAVQHSTSSFGIGEHSEQLGQRYALSFLQQNT